MRLPLAILAAALIGVSGCAITDTPSQKAAKYVATHNCIARGHYDGGDIFFDGKITHSDPWTSYECAGIAGYLNVDDKDKP